jgi:hypothetical protein
MFLNLLVKERNRRIFFFFFFSVNFHILFLQEKTSVLIPKQTIKINALRCIKFNEIFDSFINVPSTIVIYRYQIFKSNGILVANRRQRMSNVFASFTFKDSFCF